MKLVEKDRLYLTSLDLLNHPLVGCGFLFAGTLDFAKLHAQHNKSCSLESGLSTNILGTKLGISSVNPHKSFYIFSQHIYHIGCMTVETL